MFENIGKKGPAIPFIPQLLKRREKEEGGVERTHATLLPKSNHASSAHHGSTSHRQTDGWERLGKGDPKKETLKKQVWAPPYSFFTEERDQNRDVVAALPVWDRAIFVSPEEKGWSCHNSQRGMVWLQRVRELTADYQCVFHLCQRSNQNVLPCSSTRPSNPPPPPTCPRVYQIPAIVHAEGSPYWFFPSTYIPLTAHLGRKKSHDFFIRITFPGAEEVIQAIGRLPRTQLT